jgi:hypothetical protein
LSSTRLPYDCHRVVFFVVRYVLVAAFVEFGIKVLWSAVVRLHENSLFVEFGKLFEGLGQRFGWWEFSGIDVFARRFSGYSVGTEILLRFHTPSMRSSEPTLAPNMFTYQRKVYQRPLR